MSATEGEISSRRFMEAATAAWPQMSPMEIWKAWVESHDVWQAVLTARLSPDARRAMAAGSERDRDLAFVHWLEEPENLRSVRQAAGVMRRGWELDEVDLRDATVEAGASRGR